MPQVKSEQSYKWEVWLIGLKMQGWKPSEGYKFLSGSPWSCNKPFSAQKKKKKGAGFRWAADPPEAILLCPGPLCMRSHTLIPSLPLRSKLPGSLGTSCCRCLNLRSYFSPCVFCDDLLTCLHSWIDYKLLKGRSPAFLTYPPWHHTQ